MKNFDSRTYSINDFREWDTSKTLELNPRFQRRYVWIDKAKSFLMDSILRGKPIPKIFIRQKIHPKTKQTVREVVDGQQRIRTILDYLKDGFVVSKTHNTEFGGKYFTDLPDEVQRGALTYEISVDLLLDAPDDEVLDIFTRLNSYSIVLNKQELRNAKYVGEFKSLSYRLGLEHLKFWQDFGVLTDMQILRMGEAELTSELLIAMTEGIRAKKVIETFYKKYEDIPFPNANTIQKRFNEVMTTIAEMMDGTLGSSEFRRVHMFYTLFCAVYHMNYGLPELKAHRVPIKPSKYAQTRNVLASIEQIFYAEELSASERKFLDSTRRATTDAAVRKFRTEYVCRKIINALRG